MPNHVSHSTVSPKITWKHWERRSDAFITIEAIAEFVAHQLSPTPASHTSMDKAHLQAGPLAAADSDLHDEDLNDVCPATPTNPSSAPTSASSTATSSLPNYGNVDTPPCGSDFQSNNVFSPPPSSFANTTPVPLSPQNTTSSGTNNGTNIGTNSGPTIVAIPGTTSWLPDSSQSYCYSCATEFLPPTHPLDILSKLLPGAYRHHCRSCGHIFCHNCSPNRALIHPDGTVLRGYHATPDAKKFSKGEAARVARTLAARTPQRVCTPCYDVLLPLQPSLRAQFSNAQRFNSIDGPSGTINNGGGGWFARTFNSPVAFTMGHEVRKAAITLENLLPAPRRLVMDSFEDMESFHPERGFQETVRETCATTSANLRELDGVRIPGRLLARAKGIAVLTVAKAGLWVGGELGTGLVVARLKDGSWSAPSAVGLVGLSIGLLAGAQVSDHVFLLMTHSAVEMLGTNTGSVNLGADIGIAVGPVGRTVEADFGVSAGGEGEGPHAAPIYTYSLTKGLYAGASFDGKVIATRHDVNEKFYGMKVDPASLLSGEIPPPPAAQPLYASLMRCATYTKNMLGDVGNEIGEATGVRTSSVSYGGGAGYTMPTMPARPTQPTQPHQPHQPHQPAAGEHGLPDGAREREDSEPIPMPPRGAHTPDIMPASPTPIMPKNNNKGGDWPF